MRQAIAMLALLIVTGCAANGSEAYDPHLYDANGNVLAAAPPPPPPPPPPAASAPPAPECRESQRTVIIGGQPRTAVATACRQPDGSWRFTD